MRSLRQLAALALVAVGTALVPAALHAQMGGGGGGGGKSGPTTPTFRGPDGGDMAKQFERMAQLRPVLRGLTLSDAQQDSLERLEKSYARKFDDYGRAVRRRFEQARKDSVTPDTAGLRRMNESARTVQDEELAAARAILPEDQRTAFDDKVKALRDEQERRAIEIRDRIRSDLERTPDERRPRP